MLKSRPTQVNFKAASAPVSNPKGWDETTLSERELWEEEIKLDDLISFYS